jgi:hypothetical protein
VKANLRDVTSISSISFLVCTVSTRVQVRNLCVVKSMHLSYSFRGGPMCAFTRRVTRLKLSSLDQKEEFWFD